MEQELRNCLSEGMLTLHEPIWLFLPAAIERGSARIEAVKNSTDGVGIITLYTEGGTSDGGRLVECRFAKVRSDNHYSVILALAPRSREEVLPSADDPGFYPVINVDGYLGFSIASSKPLIAGRAYRLSYMILD